MDEDQARYEFLKDVNSIWANMSAEQRSKAAVKRRSKLNIKPEELAKLARLGCTMEEMAAFFDMSISEFNNRRAKNPKLDHIIVRGHQERKMSLRRAQERKVAEGDTTMLIHLGKTELGQTPPKESTQQEGQLIDASAAVRIMQKTQELIEHKRMQTVDAPIIEGECIPHSEPSS